MHSDMPDMAALLGRLDERSQTTLREVLALREDVDGLKQWRSRLAPKVAAIGAGVGSIITAGVSWATQHLPSLN